MMLWLTVGLGAGFASGAGANTEGEVTLEFTTAGAGGKYAPKHVLAVWITDARTNFVATVMRQASKHQKYLTAWNAAGGANSRVDGITGATLPRHGTRKAVWNCRDSAGRVVGDGAYLFFIEFTEGNKPGPVAVVPFTIGAAGKEQPITADHKNYSGLKVTFTPRGAATP